MSSKLLRVGYVPEHFASPLLQYHASQAKSSSATFKVVSCPSGTGEMITKLKADELDLAIALTEALIAGIANAPGGAPPPYRIIGTYVTTPLDWAVSTGPRRPFEGLEDLKGETMGISRLGSGSQIMANVMAFNHGWQRDDLQFKVLHTFDKLRAGVQDDQGDESVAAFMWERFTTKPFTDKGEVRTIGHVLTPWPSWLIVAKEGTSPDQLSAFLRGLGPFSTEFDSETSRTSTGLEYIQQTLGYPLQDVKDWIKTCRWAHEPWRVEGKTIRETLAVLEKSRVVEKGSRELTSFVNTEVATLTA